MDSSYTFINPGTGFTGIMFKEGYANGNRREEMVKSDSPDRLGSALRKG